MKARRKSRKPRRNRFCGKVFEAYNYDAAGNITFAKRNASEASAFWDTHATDPGNRLVSLHNAQDRMFPIRGSAASDASLKISVDGVETQIQRADGQEDFVFALDNSANASPLYSEIKLTATVAGGGVNGADAVSMERGSAFLHKADNALSYDNSGNLISDGRWNYKWNARQRLSEMETTEAAISAGAPKEKYVYTYDWKHRKIKAQRYLWNAETGENGVWALVSENRRYYDEWNLIYEETENGYTGTTANKYYYGADIANTVYSTGGTSGLRMANIGGTLVYVFNNQTGNVEALYKADSSNELLAEYEYTPFGETRRQSGELSNKNPLRYSTRYHKGNTGLYYYGFRHYSPVTKKWLSQDPIGELGGLNLYRFTNNDPVNFVDIFGLCCVIRIRLAHGMTDDDGNFKTDLPAYQEAEEDLKNPNVDKLLLWGCFSWQLNVALEKNNPKYKNKLPTQDLHPGFVDFLSGGEFDENGDLVPDNKPQIGTPRAPTVFDNQMDFAKKAAEDLCKNGSGSGPNKKECKSVKIELLPLDQPGVGFQMSDYVSENKKYQNAIDKFNKEFKCPDKN